MIQFYRHWDFPHPSHNPPPMVDSSPFLHNHSSSSVEIPSLQAYTQHRVQHFIVQISSMASWGDLLWSEGRANRGKSWSVKSPNKTSATMYNVMELIDMILSKQHVKNDASSILQNTWSKTNKQKLQVKLRQTWYLTFWDLLISLSIIVSSWAYLDIKNCVLFF